MNKRLRIRSCKNLMELIETTKSSLLREIYRRQYVSLASRMKKKNAA
ncbi:hypothetical protein [Paenibacillus glucanolyticus]|nr:hypothetical protein [Paenibacillus glucanolyticus]